jgi:hypothetical protein
MLSEGAVQGLPVRLPQQAAAAADGSSSSSRALPAEFEVRGEVYIRSSDFERVSHPHSVSATVVGKCVWGSVL